MACFVDEGITSELLERNTKFPTFTDRVEVVAVHFTAWLC